MSPLDLLRAVCEALVARGEPAVIETTHIYIADEWVAYATGGEVILRGVWVGLDNVIPPSHRRPTGKPGQAEQIADVIMERRKARGEVPCAA